MKTPQVLWVTSFNKEIFDASGEQLLFSFTKTKSKGDWFFGLEWDVFSEELPYPFSEYSTGINLDCFEWLTSWLKRNKDISPPKPCNCKDPWARSERDHLKGCPHTWFNRNTYRWIKKIATLKAAYEYNLEQCQQKYNFIVWIDADCRFIKKIFTHDINRLHKDSQSNYYDILYLKGPDRKVMEAGFVSYHVASPYTHNYLLGLFNYYLSGSFRELVRWDDSYVIQKLMEATRDNLNVRDIAGKKSGEHSDVFPNSLIGEFIEHDKGKHGRKLGIMK